ncbi:unnamed protein product [Burkholderia pseudomallei]|nr:unnamed protein product [Burkholderia pseudomallei]
MSARYTLFRRVAPAELPLYRRARALRAAGEHAALRTIAPPRGYAALRATWRGVEHDGWVDLDDLMRRRYPALGALAWRALDRRYALDLLSGRDAAAELPAPPAAGRMCGSSISSSARCPPSRCCVSTPGPRACAVPRVPGRSARGARRGRHRRRAAHDALRDRHRAPAARAVARRRAGRRAARMRAAQRGPHRGARTV